MLMSNSLINLLPKYLVVNSKAICKPPKSVVYSYQHTGLCELNIPREETIMSEPNGNINGDARLQALKEKLLFYLTLKVAPPDLRKIRYAIDCAIKWHKKQVRDSGEPYAIHLIETALILVLELEIFDHDMLCASLLHDTLEDTKVRRPQIIKRFGVVVAAYVVNLSKPRKTDNTFANDEARHDFYEAQVRTACNRVKILKLGDRVNNLRTLRSCSLEKMERKIKETAKRYRHMTEDIAREFSEVAKKLDTLLGEAMRTAKEELALAKALAEAGRKKAEMEEKVPV